MKNNVQVYTDGGSRGNPGIGGWGVFIVYADGREEELCGSEELTTNNRMELTAAIKALEYCADDSEIDLYTDSTYVRDGITKWIHNWKKNNWRTAAKKSVKNQDLWQQLDELSHQRVVQWHWIKGHNGEHGNERADDLCNQAMDEIS